MIDKKIKQTLKRTVQTHLSNTPYRLFVFGSHATDTHRPFSDIDLGIISDMPLSAQSIESIRQDLHDTDLPFRVDVVDFANVTDRFRSHALKNTITL